MADLDETERAEIRALLEARASEARRRAAALEGAAHVVLVIDPATWRAEAARLSRLAQKLT